MLPEDVQQAVRRAEELTRHNNKCVMVLPSQHPTTPLTFPLSFHSCRAIFNLCMPYTSRDEIASAIRSSIDETLAGGGDIEYVSPFLAPPSLFLSTPLHPSMLPRVLYGQRWAPGNYTLL